MNQTAVAEMNVAEESHWWYAGLQNLLRTLLRSPRFRLAAGPSVLDVGCGTGANLRVVHQCLRPSYLGGFDVRPDCVARAKEKCPAADVYQSDVRRPEFHRDAFDLILCCDVLSDVGSANCRDGLRDAAARLSPGGVLLLHVPAYSWLHSPHDVAVGTVERFRRGDLLQLFRDLDLVSDLVSYRLSLLFPLVVAGRVVKRLADRSGQGRLRSDLSFGPNRASSFLRNVLDLETAALSRGFAWPFGGSLVAIGRRAASGS